jgi:hypothetical protein
VERSGTYGAEKSQAFLGCNAVYRAKSDFSMRAGWGIGFMAKSGRRLVEMTGILII